MTLHREREYRLRREPPSRVTDFYKKVKEQTVVCSFLNITNEIDYD